MSTIGIDAHHANKPLKTGTEKYALDLIHALAGLGSSKEFLLYTPTAPANDLQNLGTNFRNVVLSWPPRRLWTQLCLSWEMLTAAPDTLFVPAHAIPIIHPKNTVTTLHDVGFLRMPELYSRFENLYNRVTAWFALHTAKKVIVPSEFTKREVLHFFPTIDPQRLVVVHHGFYPEPFQTQISEAAKQEVLGRYTITRPYFLYIGRLQQKKNTPRLVQAYAHFFAKHGPVADLVLIGKPDFGFEDVKKTIAEFHLENYVRMPGYVDTEDLSVLMRKAVAFTFPSLYEGFGFPVLEAQASGTPVLASTAGSLPEIGGDGALYVDPNSTDAIEKGMERLFQDPALCDQLRERGRANLQRFLWSSCAQKTLEVLTSQ